MSSFIHLNYSTQHPGVVRVEQTLAAARRLTGSKPWVAGVTAVGKAATACAAKSLRLINQLSLHMAAARYQWATAALPAVSTHTTPKASS